MQLGPTRNTMQQMTAMCVSLNLKQQMVLGIRERSSTTQPDIIITVSNNQD
jgi:hypothetical protein